MTSSVAPRIARRQGVWTNPAPWVYLIATVSWVITLGRHIPCLGAGVNRFANMCYSDIDALWWHRGLADGQIPYLQHDVEYPVLTAAIMEIGRRLTGVVGAHDVNTFFGVTALLMFVFLLGILWAHLHMSRPWDALMIALSPLIIATGLINWDMLVIFFASAGTLAWAKKRPWLAGVLFGLGTAAKLYPLLLLVPLAFLAWRAGRLRDWYKAFAGTVLSFAAVNVPVYLIAPEGWMNFWTFNVDRGSDFGSFWLVLSGLKLYTASPSLPVAIGMVVGTLAIGALMLWAPTRPRFAQGVLLIMILFMVLNKVYSPQYCLWLLPLVVMALPSWRDWAIFTAGELIYFPAIWLYLDNQMLSGDGQPRLYWAAILVRVAIHLFLAGRVVWDIYHPDRDVVRAHGADDPDGGVLDGAPDAPLVASFLLRA